MQVRLDIAGGGRLGRTLGRLLDESGAVEVGAVATRSLESAREAVEFIGRGRPVASLYELGPADWTLIATPDDAIASCAEAIASAGRLREGDIVFHCSGSLSSEILAAARSRGAFVASLHPVSSFAEPASSVRAFAGTHCGFEGDPAALDALLPPFEGIGALPFPIDPGAKAVYHAGSVMACNYLVTLVESALRCFEYGGVPREVASEILEPLVSGTADNVFRHGTVAALTGPIARGEPRQIRAQLAALARDDAELARLYRLLGLATLPLSRRQGTASASALAEIEACLEEAPSESPRRPRRPE